MRRGLITAVLAVSVSACSIPEPEALVCQDGQSLFTCQAQYTDGKARAIVFVDVPAEGEEPRDTTTTKDDFGNSYCVTLYENSTATYVAGECGQQTAANTETTLEVAATTLDASATPQSLACTDGRSVFTCQVNYSDGTLRAATFVDAAPTDSAAVATQFTRDDFGYPYCVTLYANGSATFAGGEC